MGDTAQKPMSERETGGTTMDFTFSNHGSICLLRPNNAGAATWMEERTPEGAQHWHDQLVIEPRYVEQWLYGLTDDGLTVEEA